VSSFPLWAERLYNRPLALDQFKNDVLCEFAQSRIFGTVPDKITSTSLDRSALHAAADDATTIRDGVRMPYATDGDIAVIPVRGSLVQKASWMDAESGLVGYDRLVKQYRAANADSAVGGVWMPLDSGGGECAGMFAAAEQIASMAKAEGGKPIYAWLDERACSAAYVIASAADKVYGRPEVMGGSIAAIINVVDKSQAFQKAGLEPIVIRAEWADRKARGQAGEKIDKDTIAKLTAIVDETSAQIVTFVAAMRSISEESIRDLRGDVLTGPDLVKHGLLDATMSEAEAYAALRAEIRS